VVKLLGSLRAIGRGCTNGWNSDLRDELREFVTVPRPTRDGVFIPEA